MRGAMEQIAVSTGSPLWMLDANIVHRFRSRGFRLVSAVMTFKSLNSSGNSIHGPAVARIAAQDAQVMQLVQQKETLEQTIAQMRMQAEADKARGAEAVQQVKERWKAESKAWREGCDSLQVKHRLAHLGTRAALEHERGIRLEDKETLLREKTATLLREYKITLFQVKETELTSNIAALEDDVEALREERSQILSEHEAEISRLTMKFAKAEVRLNDFAQQLATATQEKNALETENAALKASSTTNLKQVDRLNLQIETLRTQKATLESRNKELEHQVKEWETLEGRGEEEVELLKTQKTALEVGIKDLETTLRSSRGIEKKIAKLESSLLETQEQVEQTNHELAEARAEAAQAQRKASKFERQVEMLEAEIVKLAPANPPSKVRSTLSPVTGEVEETTTGTEPEQVHKPHRSNSKKVNSGTKKKGKTGEDSVTSFEQKYRKNDADKSTDEAELSLSTRKGERAHILSTKSKKESRSKIVDTDEEIRGKKRSMSKPPSKIESQNPAESDAENKAPMKKKKRKLNLNSGTTSIFAGQARFTWDQDGASTLGIPTDLSPVKEGQSVPSRSTVLMGGLKSLWPT